MGFFREISDPLNLSKHGEEKPKKTAEELALEKRTQIALDKSIGDQEDMFKALARGKLGRVSLLSGASKTAEDAATGKRFGTAGGVGSMLGGAASRGKIKRYGGAKPSRDNGSVRMD